MIPGELGWFGIWPKGKNTDGLQLDEIEYLMGKSLAYDAPISLETSFGQMEGHPLTPDILEIVRAYEQLRAAGKVPEAARAELRERARIFCSCKRVPTKRLPPCSFRWSPWPRWPAAVTWCLGRRP